MGLTEELNERRRKRLAEQQNTVDGPVAPIAPHYSSVPVASPQVTTKYLGPVARSHESYKTDTNKWFKGGAFSDGYDFGDITKTILGTTGDLATNVVQGALRIGEGLGDLALYGYAEAVDLLGGESDGIRDFARMNATDEVTGGIEDYFDRASVLGDKADNIGEGLGQVGLIIGTGGIAGAAGAGAGLTTAITTGLMGASSMGSGIGEAYEGGATDGQAWAYGALKGAIDAGSELIFGGLGKGVKALGISKGISSLDDAFAKTLSSKISSQFWSNAVQYGVKAGAEGVEEVLAGLGTAAAKKLTYMSDEELGQLIKDEKLLEQFVAGTVTSAFAQSGIVPGMKSGSLAEANKTGRDFVTGYTANEQTVIDYEYNKRVAEAEKDGKKLSNKKKNEIRDAVENDLKEGGISIDSIEEALGGDDYAAYKNLVEEEDAILKEYKDLASRPRTQAEQQRYTELEEQVKGIKEGARRGELRETLSKNVESMLARESKGINGKVNTQTDDYLLESYNERARRGQDYAPDMSKYEGKQAEIVQKAVDSGILNNTRKAHKLVDTIAKIAADKDVDFDFVNNEKLKASGFAVEGRTVNGYVKNGTIGINVESAKAWQSTVGHEITHVLEGTDMYDSLRTVLYDYAKAKGEYDSRRKALEEIYKGVEEDIDAELTADLVGDYLFQDADFVGHLSTKHRNIFQKIYDEIKYLCKVVTAGSKEARQLEKVKKAFDEAYRASKADVKTEAKSETKVDAEMEAKTAEYDAVKAEYNEVYKQFVEANRANNTEEVARLSQKMTDLVKRMSELEADGVDAKYSISLDNSQNMVYNEKRGDGYARTDEFRNLQTESQRMSNEEWHFYLRGGKNEVVRRRVSSVLQRQMDAFRRSGGFDNGVLRLSGKGNQFNIYEDVEPALFHDVFEVVRKYLRNGELVDLHKVETTKDGVGYNDCYNYLSDDGLSGFSITPDGDLISVFNASEKGGFLRAISGIVKEKVKTLDCYASPNQNLMEMYQNVFGFKTASVMDYNMEYDHDNIAENHDMPKVAFMVNTESDVETRKFSKDQYNEAVAYRNGFFAVQNTKYSLSQDSDGKQLTKEQSEYFKDSKMRDDNGNLKVMYHGSQDAGFHVFDGKYSDDDMSFFFVDRNDVAASYSGTSETYEARTIRTAEDMNKFLAEIGYDDYEAVEKDGKFELLENNEHVAFSDTTQGLYDEFCWYEGVGDGDANYKVYLNLKNPLEIDVEGRNWNNISREFSQEVYDRYKSLTAEEKEALTSLSEWGEYSIFRDEMLEARANAEQGTSGVFDDAYTKNLASAYEKLGGANANLYDAFSIAQDNFSEDALKEFAVKQMNTRDYAQKAKAEGYDGVIFKNIHDSGGYSNGSEGASTVAIAFESNQIKSVVNEKPTGQADIRYSLSLDKYSQKQYNNFGWARDTGAITKNELDDMYSKLHTKRSLKDFPQTSYGEAIIEVNDDPYALAANNVFAFVTGTKNNPEITRVVRVNFSDEASIDLFRKDIYENTGYRALETYARRIGEEYIQYYDRSHYADYRAYAEKSRAQRSGSGSKENTPSDRNGYQRSGSLGAAETDLIAPIKKASSTDDVFFDAENTNLSLSAEGERQKRYGNFFTPANAVMREIAPVREDMQARQKFFEASDEYALPVDDIGPVAKPTKPTAKPATGNTAEDIGPLFDTGRADQVDGQQTLFAEGDGKKTAEDPVAQVLTEEPEAPKQKGRAWNKLRANVLDKGSVVEDLSLKMKNRELMGKWNQMLNSESSAQWLIGHGADGVKSLNDIRAEVESTGKTQEFYDYLYHRHNVDRMSLESRAKEKIDGLYGKFGHLKLEQIRAIAAKEITDKTTERTAATVREAREYLNALDARNKPVYGDSVTAEVSQDAVKQYEAKNPEFSGYAEDVYAYNDYLRKKMVEAGIISQDTADLWAAMYPHYVPIRRVGHEGLNVNVPLDTGRTGVNAPIKGATGGNSDILPLFDTMALRTEQTFRAIDRNRFGIELKNTLGTTIDSKSATLDELMDSVEQDGELLKKGEHGMSPTFTVFENGERVEFEITEDLYDALKPTPDILKGTSKVLNKATNIQRGILTEYNPVFLATNAFKDAQDVLINSQHPVRTYKNMPLALKELATKGKWYTEYMQNGGEENTYFDGKSKTFTKDDTGIKKIIGIPLRAISTANNFIERAPRLAEYIASRKAGASAEVAMLDAARVTTNFAAGGDVTKFLNRNGATFLNASVQGFNQQVRNIREAKMNGLKGWAKLATKCAIAGIPAMLLNHLLWDDDEEYEQLSDYVKQNYYVVAKFGDGKFVRIPKGRTMAVIQNAFEQMGNLITGNDEVDLGTFLELFVNNLAPNNPLDNNVFAPISQALTNRTWYGEELVPTRLQDLPAAEQYDESTDAISKWLGEKINISPYKINYVLDQYGGGIGDVFLPMFTPETDGGGILAPWKDKFITDSVMKNQNVSDFYDTKDELAKSANSAHATAEDILKYKYVNSVNSELGELYQKKRELQNSNLSDDVKYDAVREVQKQIDALAKDALATYGDVEIDGRYAIIGDRYYRKNEDGEWQKITEDQLEKQEEVTAGLGITPSEYWSNKGKYDFVYEYPEKSALLYENGLSYEDYENGSEDFKDAYSWASNNPGKYAMSKAVTSDVVTYRQIAGELYDIKADKDASGKSISGSRKAKVINYINNSDLDYGARIILYKSEYKEDDTYNTEIVEYLNSREDISYEEMVAILEELGFKVKADGTVTWD